MIYDSRRGIHDSLQTVLLYACPNLNARYTSDSIAATLADADNPICAVCGRSARRGAVHHEPPRSKGSLVLSTPHGNFVVKPTLLLLCRECHQDRHDRAELAFAWRFDDRELEASFLAGEFFKQGYAEHDERFWEHGRLIVSHRGRRWEIRG